MEFSRKKLPKEAGGALRSCPIESVQPFAAMPAPVYVYLRANEKFVAVKGPLDYFTPEELKKLLPMESLFLPGFIDQVQAFREAGARIRAVLTWRAPTFEQQLAPYEVSDAVIRIFGPLWNRAGIESLFICAFALDLCGPLPGEVIEAARDRDVEAYERLLIASSWVAFLALHLGYCDLAFLTRARLAVFEGKAGALPAEIGALARVVTSLLEESSYRALAPESFELVRESVGQKIYSRLGRIARQFMDHENQAPSIYGKEGFVDE